MCSTGTLRPVAGVFLLYTYIYKNQPSAHSHLHTRSYIETVKLLRVLNLKVHHQEVHHIVFVNHIYFFF